MNLILVSIISTILIAGFLICLVIRFDDYDVANKGDFSAADLLDSIVIVAVMLFVSMIFLVSGT